jgi:hypothetical protein
LNITLLSINIATQPTKTGGSYQIADVAYKNNTFQGKVEGKKVMSFGATAEAFKVLATAQQGETYEVDVKKNDKGYNDWIAMSKASVAAGTAAAPGQSNGGARQATASPRSTYETPEERAKRQVSIIRQSSLGHAVSTLAVGAKSLDPAKVIDVAKQYEAYVHAVASFAGGATGFDDVPDFPIEEPSIS